LKTIIKNENPDQKIRLEQVKMLYQSIGSLLLINLLVSASLVYGFWDIVSHTTLLVWMGLMLTMLLVRAAFYLSYRKYFNPEHIKRYSAFLIIGSAAAGIIWGMAGILLFPADQLEYQLFILLSLLAMTGGSTFTLSIYLPAYFAFSPITLLPITINLFLIGDSIHITLGAVTLVYLMALTSFNIKINRNFKLSWQLRYENLDLIEQLHEQKNEADRANMAKSKFLAAASHDLRQPLYALSLFTTVLDESVKEPKIKKVVDQINVSVDALQSLFDALLDISQLDAGVMKTEKSDFFVEDVFTKLANDFDPQAADKGLELSWLPCPYAVHSEATLLEQILRNYLSNAIRYTQQGGIQINCEVNDSLLTIKVIDTGPGIDAGAHEDIFTEFYQLSNPERDRIKGLGLGLSIVQRTAKLLGHSIAVESQPGKGSLFSVSVPLADIPQRADTQAPSPLYDTVAGAPPLILVVDDERSIREGMRDLLEIWDYDVITAADGNAALEQLQSTNRIPDAIISDFRLRKNQTGLDVIKAIHNAYHADIPALIVTGDIEQDRLVEMNTSHFQVLFKPVAPVKLRTFLRNITRQQSDAG
jgi:signal transduction histidine kinase/CheY-like chemotaxis protein